METPGTEETVDRRPRRRLIIPRTSRWTQAGTCTSRISRTTGFAKWQPTERSRLLRALAFPGSAATTVQQHRHNCELLSQSRWIQREICSSPIPATTGFEKLAPVELLQRLSA